MAAESAIEEELKEASESRLSEEARQAMLAEAIEKNEKLAESELELARWFVENGRHEFAVRRLKKIGKEYPLSSYVSEAKRLLQEIQSKRKK